METSCFVDYYVEVILEADSRDPVVPLVPIITRRIPAQDRPHFNLPDGIPYFCFPLLKEGQLPPVIEKGPTFFTFSLTAGDGTRTYGAALQFHPNAKKKIGTEEGTVLPKVLCILSHSPSFSFFKYFLSWLYHSRERDLCGMPAKEKIELECQRQTWLLSPRGSKLKLRSAAMYRTRSLPEADVSQRRSSRDQRDVILIDRILNDFILTVSMPSPHEDLLLQLKFNKKYLFRDAWNHSLPHVDDDCFRVLFQRLSPRNVVQIVNGLLLEQRILIHSTRVEYLTPACEALCALMYPFQWEHVYIPLLPLTLLDYLQAPVPFLMGIHTSSLTTKTGADIFASCIVVHLDKNQVITPIHARLDHLPIEEPHVDFPSKLEEALVAKCTQVIPSHIACAWSHTPPFEEKELKEPQRRHGTATRGSKLEWDEEGRGVCSEVEITFGPGPLGITFESTHLRVLAAGNFHASGTSTDASAVVKAFPRLRNGVPGPAELSGQIREGSYLMAINGKSTLHCSFEETIAMLRATPRPMVLRFQRAARPHANARAFASKIKALSAVPVVDEGGMRQECDEELVEDQGWIDAVRLRFIQVYTVLLSSHKEFLNLDSEMLTATETTTPKLSEKYHSQRQFSTKVAFNFKDFLEHSKCSHQEFLGAFMETQSFHAFVNSNALFYTNCPLKPSVKKNVMFFQSCIEQYQEAQELRTPFYRTLSQKYARSQQNQVPVVGWTLPHPIEVVDQAPEELVRTPFVSRKRLSVPQLSVK